MQTSFYSVIYPPMIRALENLSSVMEKAAAHAEAHATAKRSYEEALLNDRIIFNQFPLVRQVQIACDNAKNSVLRLGAGEAPSYEDTETTFEQLQERIAKTVEFLKSVTPENINDKDDVRVSLPHWNGKSVSGYEYATQYLVPNFYFHVTTAYAIIRKNGVAVGKSDYIGALPLK